MTLDHPRAASLCSPTATTAVARHLTDDAALNPPELAQGPRDSTADIFGNWVPNAAQASQYLGPDRSARVEKLDTWLELYHYPQRGLPVVVSLQGPLPGSALPYAQGHLLVVTGCNPTTDLITCMDPAFSTADSTHVEYLRTDFIRAWERRGRLAYIFTPQD